MNEQSRQSVVLRQNPLAASPALQESYKLALVERVNTEAMAWRDFVLPLHMDVHTLMCAIGAMQLALRHPANTGPAARVVREVIDRTIDRLDQEGFSATAEMLRLGDRPEYDEA